MTTTTVAIEVDVEDRQTRSAGQMSARSLYAWRALVLLAVLGAWQLASLDSNIIPSVGETAAAIWRGLVTEGGLREHTWHTLYIVFIGFVISIVLGALTGLLLGTSTFWGRVLEPLFTALFAIPRILLYPALLALFGFGIAAKVWLSVIAAYFPVAIQTMVGVRNVSPTLRRLGRSLNASPWQMVTKILLPAALPVFMVGVRVCFGSAFVIVVLAEMYSSRLGLGSDVAVSYSARAYPELFAAVVVICVLALIGNFMLWAAERRVRRALG